MLTSNRQDPVLFLHFLHFELYFQHHRQKKSRKVKETGMPKKKDEYPEIKDTSRPSRDAASMKETTGQSQAEWEAIKARGKPTDEEYEARYQALLKRYNISPDNNKTSKSRFSFSYSMGCYAGDD